jgi:hypothetical protein
MFRDIATIYDYYNNVFKNIKEKIFSEKDEFIIGASTDELAEYYFSKNHLQEIKIDNELNETVEYKKDRRTILSHEREEPWRGYGDIKFEYKSVLLTIPIIPNNDLNKIAKLETLPMVIGGPPLNMQLNNNSILCKIDIKGYGFELSEDEIISKIKHEKEKITKWIKRKNDNINTENGKLRENIKELIDNRKKELYDDQKKLDSLVKKIKIPLKKKEDESIKRIKLNSKSLVKRLKPVSTIPEEYVLDRNKVLDIISVIDNQGRQFEKTPLTYESLEEEDLRNIILVNLNSLFEGKATGESFSNRGKTDIYLNIDKGNILISECKIWHGKALYNETIDQLLKYLTWRNNFGIIISFVRLKNFSQILKNMDDIIKNHSSYNTGFKTIYETHFLSHHKLAQDELKNVEIHHLFYNLFVG